MKRVPPERKESIMRKMAPPINMSVAELARQEGISTATLYNWRSNARQRGTILPSNSNPPDKWSSEDKFRTVLETAPLNATELSAYCRKHGLYPEQVEAWREACLSANARSEEQQKQSREAQKEDRKKIGQLEKELSRKDKALAETAALLVLSKKAKAIWGSNDGDE